MKHIWIIYDYIANIFHIIVGPKWVKINKITTSQEDPTLQVWYHNL